METRPKAGQFRMDLNDAPSHTLRPASAQSKLVVRQN